MEGDFSGQKVIVAGGSRGIGRAIALAFAARGASVSICARGADALESTRNELASHGTFAHALTCDLSDADQIAAYIAKAAAALGGIDVLVNNATASGLTDDEKGWAASIAVDLMAVVRATHAARQWLERSEYASIVNIASTLGLEPSVRSPPYGAAKAAVIQHSRTLAAALIAKNIRVNCIAPGAIEFPGGIWDQRRINNPDLYAKMLQQMPLGRMGRPEEIANIVTFLASRQASWVTGQTIVVDGGGLLGT